MATQWLCGEVFLRGSPGVEALGVGVQWSGHPLHMHFLTLGLDPGH